MIQIENLLIADEGFRLRKKEAGEVVGKEYLCGYIYYDNEGTKLPTPYLESEIDFDEVSIDTLYGELVDLLIREKYSPSAEFAIQRQRDTKPDVFQEYFDYCEECKKRAKRELGLD